MSRWKREGTKGVQSPRAEGRRQQHGDKGEEEMVRFGGRNSLCLALKADKKGGGGDSRMEGKGGEIIGGGSKTVLKIAHRLEREGLKKELKHDFNARK